MNKDVPETKNCGSYASMLIQHSFTNLGASPPQNASKSPSPHPYTHQTTPCPTAPPNSPPKTNPKNLRTLTPRLEVTTPIAKAISGTIQSLHKLAKAVDHSSHHHSKSSISSFSTKPPRRSSNPSVRRAYFSPLGNAFCIENFNISRSDYLPRFHRILRLPQKVTLQDHQILRLPRTVTLQDHQMLRLPRKVPLEDHQILPLPRKMN